MLLKERCGLPFFLAMGNLRRVGCRAVVLGTVLAGAVTCREAQADPATTPTVDGLPTPSVYTREGLMGPVRFVPTLGVGAPDGLRLGAFAKWRGLLASGAAFSYLPDSRVPGTEASIIRVSGEAFARVHPFRGAFFVGLAGGLSQTKGTLAAQRMAFNQMQRVEVHAYARLVYLAPHLGFQWMLPHDLTLGFDVGVEIPLATAEPSFDAAKYGLVFPIEGKGAVADATRYVSRLPIPVVHLLEIGYAL